MDLVGLALGRRQRDGNRPEQAGCGVHDIANSLPVGLGHEPVKRRKATDAQHDEVAFFPRAHLQLWQAGGVLEALGEGLAFEQQRLESVAAVGFYQCHVFVSFQLFKGFAVVRATA